MTTNAPVHRSGARALIHRLASLVLAVCFALPLSQCAQKQPADGPPVASASVLHGYDLAAQGWLDLRGGQVLDGLGLLFAVLAVFFLPVACLRMHEPRRAALCLLASIPAAWCLDVWVFAFATDARSGGVIAVACWTLLFCTSGATLLSRWRRKTRAG